MESNSIMLYSSANCAVCLTGKHQSSSDTFKILVPVHYVNSIRFSGKKIKVGMLLQLNTTSAQSAKSFLQAITDGSNVNLNNI